MFGRKRSASTGKVDGGEGRGIPLGGRDDRPPTGYRNEDEDEIPVVDEEETPMLWEEEDPADRRRDPLRR